MTLSGSSLLRFTARLLPTADSLTTGLEKRGSLASYSGTSGVPITERERERGGDGGGGGGGVG